MRIRFTATARIQFLEGLDYIRRDNPSAARRLRRRVEESLRRLEDHPDSGRRIPEFPEVAHREVIVRLFRFFYRVEKRTVWVVAVWHGAQLPELPGAVVAEAVEIYRARDLEQRLEEAYRQDAEDSAALNHELGDHRCRRARVRASLERGVVADCRIRLDSSPTRSGQCRGNGLLASSAG